MPELGTVPSQYHLLAALRAGATIDEAGNDVASVEASYLRLPTDGLFDVAVLKSGMALLRRLGLVYDECGSLLPDTRLRHLLSLEEAHSCRLLLAMSLAQLDPIWLQTAVAGSEQVANELIPDAAQAVLVSVIPDPAEREAMLLALANTVDVLANAEVGGRGEEYVVEQCRAELLRLGRSDLLPAVQRLSLISDQLGYDVVAPRTDGEGLRLEVKTTRHAASADVSFFLSRNEARVGARDDGWRLVVCRLQEPDEITIVGTCDGATLVPFLPSDVPRGSWTVASITLPLSSLNRGLPRLDRDYRPS